MELPRHRPRLPATDLTLARMEKLHTSLNIIRHSLVVLIRHPQLLWFVAIELALGYLAYRFYFTPVFETSTEAMRSAASSGQGWDGNPAAHFPYGMIALAYLPGMFLATFFNVALYSQILQALNGGQVSLARGLALAREKLPAIIAWSLLAGTVGMLLRLLQERTGPLGRWIAGLVGFTWSAASAFVVPVIINEPGRRRPIAYLQISAALLKRVWGEGAIAFAGIGLIGLVAALVLIAIGSATYAISDQNLVLVYPMVIVSYLIFALLYMVWRVFECGLYIYASEGVAPGTFDEELFQRAWVVGAGAGAGTVTSAQRPALPRKLLMAVAGIVAACVAVIWMSQPPRPVPVQYAGPEVGIIAIDLAALDHELQYSQLQAVGLFTDRMRHGCGFPPEPALEMLHERVAGEVTATMMRQGRFLYIHFFGADAQPVEQRITTVRDDLRARFPGRGAAINTVHSVPYVPRTTLAEWQAVPGAASYTIELDCYHCCGDSRWCSDVGRQWKLEEGLSATRHSFDWVGSQPGRWRVWPVDAEGRAGPKSGWTGFDYSYSPCGSPAEPAG
jgi:hypothetical protein